MGFILEIRGIAYAVPFNISVTILNIRVINVNEFSRTGLVIGQEGLEKLKSSKVIVFGVGGVGSYVVEALCRAGVGGLTLVDFDTVCVTNINRQVIALHSTIGQSKVQVLKKRLLDINPQAQVCIHNEFVDKENIEKFINEDLTYIVDAIDNVAGKVLIIEKALKANIPVISAMGAGNRMNPEMFKIGDISETNVCPLARVMRKELKKRGIQKGVHVAFSTEPPIKTRVNEEENNVIGSISFVPSVAGLLIASKVIKDILDLEKEY